MPRAPARDRVLDRMGLKTVLFPMPTGSACEGCLRAPHARSRCRYSLRIRLTTRCCRFKDQTGHCIDASTPACSGALESLAHDRLGRVGLEYDRRHSLRSISLSGDVLARVGSPDYLDDRRAGQVDMTRAVRSPGSTLKPFIYGLAFEDGFVHPESLIDDRPIRFGSYAPENFDMTFQGTVPVRKALQMSLNVPAVALLDRVGASRLSSRLKQAGANLELPKDETPGLRWASAASGSRCRTSCSFTRDWRGSATRDPAEIQGQRDVAREPERLLDQVAAWQVGNVLLGTPPPENGVRNRIAFKTGTSYGYRDAWSIGFDGRITIGVWVGRPDGAPVPGIAGRIAAAPILFDAFARTGKLPAALPKPPKGTLMASNAKLPLPLRRYRPLGELVRTDGERAPHIQFPLNGSRIDVSGADGASASPMPVKVAGGVLPITMLVNGMSVGELDSRRQRLIDSPGPGFARLTVIDAKGAADTVVVRIQ